MATSKQKTKPASKRGAPASAGRTGRREPGPSAAAPSLRAAGASLRAELKTLKKLVLLQKAKQRLLTGKQPGPVQVDTLLSDYLKVILNLTSTSAGSIMLHEDDALVFRASLGPGSSRLKQRRLPQDEGIAGWVFQTGTTYLSSDASRDPRWSSKISAELRFSTRNILAAPLRIAEKVLGVVEIINKKDGKPFGRDDKEMLETLAGQLALDVAYANLLAGSLRESQHRATQMGLSMVLNSSLNQRTIRTRAIEALTSLLDAEVGSLLLVDERTKDLYFEVALGEKEDRVKQMRLKMGEGIAGWVAANDQQALINDVQNDPRYFRRAQTITDFVTRNMVCVPVRSKGRVIGVLQAINKKNGALFADEDLESCWTLSNQVAVALENAHLYAELKETFLNTAEALAAAVEKRDPYTGGHIKRVVEYSMAIARHLASPLTDMEDLRLAAVLHDIGKIGIKDSVLLKQARLDHEEIAHMREHPLVGEDILEHIEQMKQVRKIMRAHHEKWDGTGYPDGLKGEDIPVHARIIAIADTFDAITTDRPYRRAADWKTAVDEIKRCSGTEYDPVLVDAFTRACEAGDITIVGSR
jgi:HD-GYP domain-containing protein (c-di-GMP phosphodiesterase class II)